MQTENTPAFAWFNRTALLLVFVLGLALRIFPSAGFTGVGWDEKYYAAYVATLSENGLADYPSLVAGYNNYQRGLTYANVPPTRAVFICAAHFWSRLSGLTPLRSLHRVACLFSCLLLGLSFVFALRLGGWNRTLAVTALMACAPLQLHMAQYTLIDGVFAFWALICLWLLWENLKRPDHPVLLVSLAACLALMVATKENAFFVYVTLLALLAANRWLGFGTVTRRLLLVILFGPLLGVALLVLLAGGFPELVLTYREWVSKSLALPFAINHQDGPWYRYLVDLMVISPVILILALGELFHLRRSRKPELFLALFLGVSYLLMCNIKYGLNLRYAVMWDFSLRYLAAGRVAALCSNPGRGCRLALALCIAALCLFDLRQYWIFTVQHSLYELVSDELLRCVGIVK